MNRSYALLLGLGVAAFVACGGSGDKKPTDNANVEDAGATSNDSGPGGNDATIEPSGDAAAVDAGTGADAEDSSVDAATDADVDAGVDAGPPTFTVYDTEGHVLGQYDHVGAPLVEIAYLADTPIAMMTAASTYTVYADHLDTPRALADSTNTIVWRWDGDAFGMTAPNEDPDGDGSAVSMPLRFPGQVFDPESSLHYNMFRDYDPMIGRYIQPDPLGLRGGFNLYGYTSDDPINRIDRLGLLDIKVEDALRRSESDAPANPSSSNNSNSSSSNNDPPPMLSKYDYCVKEMGKDYCDNLYGKPKPPPKKKSWCDWLFDKWPW